MVRSWLILQREPGGWFWELFELVRDSSEVFGRSGMVGCGKEFSGSVFTWESCHQEGVVVCFGYFMGFLFVGVFGVQVPDVECFSSVCKCFVGLR